MTMTKKSGSVKRSADDGAKEILCYHAREAEKWDEL